MGSLDVGGEWCPECGAEYRPGFVECSDCRVSLTDLKPDTGAGRGQQDGRDHDQLVYDMAEWSGDRRGGLSLLLVSAAIVHEWREGFLVVPMAKQEGVEDLIAFIEGQDEANAVPDATDDVGATEPDDESIPLAGPGRRLVGYLIDGFVLGVPTALVFFVTGPSRWVDVFGSVIAAIYEIAGTARWGRTLGKSVARTRVIVADGWTLPGWSRAATRWAVQAGPGVAALAVPPDRSLHMAVFILTLGWGAAVYWGVLWHSLRQGLHDRAAGTIVVVA